jgi:hypothetical protein
MDKKDKGLSKERKEVKQFREDLQAGKITSYDQFPKEYWGLGMLLEVSFVDEMSIFNRIREKGQEIGVGRDFGAYFLKEAKDMMEHNREKEALIIAYWLGKIFGSLQRDRDRTIMPGLGG